ncbi:MAG: hypothetical protein KKB51_18085 [Candidatus Riflebacteria bacterium]|nr:hypothetical protein [Candidatus Riflebacteria bacterium]
MKSNKEEAQEHMIRELLFDLSSDDRTVRAGAINDLAQFAAHDAVVEAVRKRHNLEQDPYCKKGLEDILTIGARESDGAQIRLVEKPFKLGNSSPPAPTASTVPSPLPASKAPPIAAESPKTKASLTDEITPIIIAPPAQQKSFKAKLAEFVDFLKLKLEWAAQNNLKASNLGMVIILVVLVSFATLSIYSIIKSGERFSFSGLEKTGKPQVLGEIQTKDVAPGSVLKGTLKEYNLFGQSWVFISDDDRVFKIKLDKSPSFYKAEEKLNVLVEACEKTALGHTILIAKVTPLERRITE